MISKLLATTNVSLSTVAAAVTAPTDLLWKTVGITVSAESSGSLVKWERQAASDSTYSSMCLDAKEFIPIATGAGQTIFYAKLSASTATLDVEWWG